MQGWKTAYSKEHKHQEAFICNMLATHSKIFTSYMLATVTESEPLLHFQYLRAINDMECLKLGFEDIYLYFFRKDINVVFNLLGLHYSYFHLGLPVSCFSNFFLLSWFRWSTACRTLFSLRINDRFGFQSITQTPVWFL